jgi:hypothetical protein
MKEIRQVIVDGKGESEICIKIIKNTINLFKEINSVKFNIPILFTPDNINNIDGINIVKINKLSYQEYNGFLLNIFDYWKDDSYLMLCQPDGYPIISKNWTDDFLNYDYIGAPWPFFNHTFRNRVGNGGFSIRSKKYLYTCKKLFNNFPNIEKYHMYEDFLCCNIYYDEMLSLGIKFAPIEIASKFSYENIIPERNFDLEYCFGMHDLKNEPIEQKAKYKIY